MLQWLWHTCGALVTKTKEHIDLRIVNEKRCNLRRGPEEKSEQVVGYFPGNRYRTEQEADEEKFTLPVVTV